MYETKAHDISRVIGPVKLEQLVAQRPFSPFFHRQSLPRASGEMRKNVKGIGGGTFNLVGAPNVIVLVLFVLALDDFQFILNTRFAEISFFITLRTLSKCNL